MRSKHKKHYKKKAKHDNKLRRTIALEAAKMMYQRNETEYFTAKRKAARSMGIDFRYSPSDLPSNREIREQILQHACLFEGEKRFRKLQEMRLYALWIMRELQAFSPRLIGSTWTGHIRKGSDIDIHVFADSLAGITQILENYGLQYHVERKRIVKYNEERNFIHIHVHGRFELELTVYGTHYVNYRFKSSITGKAIENATLRQLEKFMEEEYPQLNLSRELERHQSEVECYEMFKLLLLPLENIQGGLLHPEGDMLYHSLQVFELARQESYGYDLEFLQAALLHDVGKAIDAEHHAQVAAEVLEGFVSQRVIFLIANHMEMLKLQQGTLGHKKKLKLRNSELFEDAMALRDFDNRGRQPGRLVDSVDEVLEYIKSLEDWDCYDEYRR